MKPYQNPVRTWLRTLALFSSWLALAAGTTVEVERLRQNTRYQAIAPSLLGDQRRGAAALGVVALTASR